MKEETKKCLICKKTILGKDKFGLCKRCAANGANILVALAITVGTTGIGFIFKNVKKFI